MTTPTNPPTGPEREPATYKTSLRYGEPTAPTVQPEQESDGKDRARSVLEALNVPTHPTPATATPLELLTPVERLALELSEMEPEGLMRANNHLRAKNERLERELQAATAEVARLKEANETIETMEIRYAAHCLHTETNVKEMEQRVAELTRERDEMKLELRDEQINSRRLLAHNIQLLETANQSKPQHGNH